MSPNVAEIFQKYIGEYKRTYRLSYEQQQAASAIMDCRTPAMGGVMKLCSEPGCGHWEFHWKACKNRHCPQCGSFEKAQWLEQQKVWLLPIHYYHVVFTIDHVFNRLVSFNQEWMYNLFFRVVAQLMKEYGQKYLGGEIGFTAVLHTWGQTMQQHPHLHLIVTGGALVKTADGYLWQAAERKFLFPVKLLSKDFRTRFCAALRQDWAEGNLNTNDDKLNVEEMLVEAESKDWEVYIQSPLYDTEKLIEYLGRYVFRIAISNHRIVSVEKGQVTFSYFDNRDDGKQKEMTLSAVEFIRRFLSHVLPNGFVRIRHFGLHHGSCRSKLQQARRLLGLPYQLPIITKLKFLDWIQKVLKTDQDPRQCPVCKTGRMVPIRDIAPMHGWRRKLFSFLDFFLPTKPAQWKPAPA